MRCKNTPDNRLRKKSDDYSRVKGYVSLVPLEVHPAEMRPIASTNLSRFLSPLAIPMPIVSRCIIAGSVKHRARRFLAEVKAKDEGAKETTASTTAGAAQGGQWRRISLVRMRGAFRDLSDYRPGRQTPAGLSRPRHSVRDTIRRERVVSSSGFHRIHPCPV